METEVAGVIDKADKKLYILCSCSPLQRSCNEKKIFASTEAVFTNVWWGTIESISLFGLTLFLLQGRWMERETVRGYEYLMIREE